MKVKNMTSPKGNTVANQFFIRNESVHVFQSYDSIIAVRDWRVRDNFGEPTITLDKNRWNYSVTTGKYRNQFLNEGLAETRKKIEAGIYKLDDLNAEGYLYLSASVPNEHKAGN